MKEEVVVVQEMIEGTDKDNPVHPEEIKSELDLEQDNADSVIQDIVDDVVEHYDMPVGDTTKGYFEIQDRDDLMYFKKRQSGKAEKIRKRTRKVAEAYSDYGD